MVTPAFTRLVASRLCVDPATINVATLKKAAKICSAENPTSSDYWDALANSGQLHGNVPFSSMVAILYDWLMQ